jgi:hypothetical protein
LRHRAHVGLSASTTVVIAPFDRVIVELAYQPPVVRDR